MQLNMKPTTWIFGAAIVCLAGFMVYHRKAEPYHVLIKASYGNKLTVAIDHQIVGATPHLITLMELARLAEVNDPAPLADGRVQVLPIAMQHRESDELWILSPERKQVTFFRSGKEVKVKLRNEIYEDRYEYTATPME